MRVPRFPNFCFQRRTYRSTSATNLPRQLPRMTDPFQKKSTEDLSTMERPWLRFRRRLLAHVAPTSVRDDATSARDRSASRRHRVVFVHRAYRNITNADELCRSDFVFFCV